jgi:nucleoside-diphosphate-sugar epimerase
VVIGGLGFLGGAVGDELLRRGDDVLVVDAEGDQAACDARFGGGVPFVHADVRDRPALAGAFAGADEVYHLAGALGTSELEDDVALAVAVNVSGSVNVFDAARAAGVERVFHACKPNVWLNTYSITKFAAEQFGLLFAEQHGLSVRGLRYFNAYGPGQHLWPVRKLVPSFAAAASRGLPLEVFGDGEQVVDLIYAPDLARLTVDFTRSSCTEVVDCGRGVPITVNEVAHAVNRWFGNTAGVLHLPMRRGEREGTTLVADLGELVEAIGPLVFSDWEQSLGTTLEWYARCHPSAIDEALSLCVAAS